MYLHSSRTRPGTPARRRARSRNVLGAASVAKIFGPSMRPGTQTQRSADCRLYLQQKKRAYTAIPTAMQMRPSTRAPRQVQAW